jgi:cytochrome c-type biogenesis protein CcmH/NrfG
MPNASRVRLAATGLGLLMLVACGEPAPEVESPTAEILVARTTGLTFLQRDQLDEARGEFERLIQLAPEEAIGYTNLGLVHLRRGDLSEAERAVHRALEIEPENLDVRLILARIYEVDGRVDEALGQLEEAARRDPDHVRTLYALAELFGRTGTAEGFSRRADYLQRVVALEPASLAARLQLAEALLRGGEADAAAAQLEELRRQAPTFPAAAAASFREALTHVRAARNGEALAPLASFGAYFEVTSAYQAAMQDLRGPPGTLVGIPNFTFSHEFSLRVQEEAAVLAALRFTDATVVAGLDLVPTGGGPGGTTEERRTVVALADIDGDGDQDLYAVSNRAAASERSGFLLRNDLGRFVETTAEANVVHAGEVSSAIFGDYDDDRRLDLYIVRAGGNLLYRNVGDGRFEDVTQTAGIAGPGGGAKAVFVDLDLDGDLDIYEARDGVNRFYRNNGDGRFQERAAATGIAGGEEADSRDAVFGDFDDDHDVDLFVLNANGSNALFSNVRQGRFEIMTVESGLAGGGSSGAAAVGDYDNDGSLDLFVTALSGGAHTLYHNEGDGTFEVDRRSDQALSAIRDLAGLGAVFFDFDNDGHLDLLVIGEPRGESGRGVVLFRNDGTGRFEEASRFLPRDLQGAGGLAVADYNEDGDLDVFLAASDGGVRLLRNDGANVNHYFKIELVGLGEGSGKNNRFGIGSRVEVRAGDLFQARVATDPITHFGLGHRLKADVVRVEWTNGVTQDIYYPGSDEELAEERTLKGSCPFVYAWDGRRFSFVTDVMWRSALGMPLGIMGADQAYAPAAASREYVRIPAEALEEKEGEYILQLTEELWEIFYVDEVKLVAVDHPDTIDIYVNERFVPPGPASLTVHQVAGGRVPVTATDGEGSDVLPQIRDQDDVYVSNLRPTRYQGVVELHDLILDLGEIPGSEPVTLYLNGWIFPTDASINVAMSQSRRDSVIAPYLEVIGAGGEWTRAIDDLGFPAGKSKTVIADLTGKFPTPDHRVRIRTNMQIYWDRVFFSVGIPSGELRTTAMDPASADLHFRGFSREYRKGGRYGPHWFEYEEISTEPRWLPLEGTFTRFGDVQPLLLEPDDRYVIMGPGDEATIAFDAGRLPSLPPGWRRDFLLYSVGWVKDADLNTATGNTVYPLPFHDMSRYPYVLSDYNTRRFEAGAR